MYRGNRQIVSGEKYEGFGCLRGGTAIAVLPGVRPAACENVRRRSAQMRAAALSRLTRDDQIPFTNILADARLQAEFTKTAKCSAARAARMFGAPAA